MKRVLLAAMVALAACELAWAAEEAKGGEDAATTKVREALRDKKVSFDFVETQLPDVANFLKATLGVNVVLAPDLDATRRVTLRVNDMEAGAAVHWLARLVGARVEVKNGAVVISVAARAEPGPPHQPPGGDVDDEAANRRIEEILRTKKITFDFVETPLQDVVTFISGLVDVTFVLDHEAVKDEPKTVTLRVNNMNTGSALRWVTRLVGLELRVIDGAVFVTRPAPKREPPAAHEGKVGSIHIKLGAVADLTLEVYGEDLPPETRELMVRLVHRALEAEMDKAGKAGAAPVKPPARKLMLNDE